MFRHVTLGFVLLAIVGSPVVASASDDAAPRVASLWSLFGSHDHAVYDSLPGDVTPHPAVARIIVPEDGATAFGSGTLVGVHENRGLVITNWHVVRDAVGLVDVVFPDGFHSHARPLKVDSDWDLAALVIWRPTGIEPVKIAAQPPRPGDLLTIHGYGRGKYRIATGHCTTFYSPRPDFPHEMVELDVEARQGDSGGPIFNQAGELAGVLFGAGQGTTLGSFAPRVRVFLASVAPDLDETNDRALASTDKLAPNITASIRNVGNDFKSTYPSSPWSPPTHSAANKPNDSSKPSVQLAGVAGSSTATPDNSAFWESIATNGWYEPLKTLLAAVGLTAIALRLLRSVR